MASTYLTRTFTATGNRKIFTTSFWVKRSGLSSGQSPIFSSDYNNSNDTYSMMYFTNDYLAFYSKDNTTTLQFLTNARFRDVNGWYNIVIAFDTTQTTASNRVKFYVNGEQITSFDTATYPPLDADNTWFNRNWEHVIGRRSYDGATYFDGSLSHFNFIDGTAYDASAFGSTDSTTGEWKINTSPSVTYGTNGFFILKDGNSVTDQSGNSNNWSVGGGTLTKTEDSPSNVFATGNPLFVKLGTWSNGNNSIVGSTSTNVRPQMWSTLGAKTGKFYAEAKYTDKTGGMVGVSDYTATNTIINAGTYQGNAVGSWGFWNDGSKYDNGQGSSSYGSAWNTNDIIQIALDLDNEFVYFGINGTWQNSGNPASGASGTYGLALTNTRDEHWFMSWGDGSQGNSATCHVNYGNGYFATTAVSSNSGNGYSATGSLGIFQYQPPTGYTALSTKGLNL